MNGGTLAIAGAGGSLPQVSTFTVNSGATLAINNTANNANRINDFAQVIVNSGTFNYITGAATGNPAEQMGNLTLTGTGRVNIDATTAASSTILRFASLTPIPSGNNVIFSGTDLGGNAGFFTRILFDTEPVLTMSRTVLNAGFSNVSNGASQGLAGYDTNFGIVLVPTPAVSGNDIDNFPTTSVPISAIFTTNGPTTARTGAVVYQLILDGGDVNLIDGLNGPSPTNNNTPFGTLGIGNSITSQNGPKAITQSGATNPTIAFGNALANITTTSDLTIDGGISLTGSVGTTKFGAGALIMNGNYSVTGGPLTVDAGTLTFGSTSTIVGQTNITANSGTVVNFNGTAAPTLSNLSLGAGAAANLTQNVTTANLVGPTSSLNLLGGNLTLTNPAALTYNGVISGSGSLIVNPTAAALLTLGGDNAAFSGGITGNGNARLAINHENALGTGAVDLSAQNASSTASIPTLGFNFGNSSFTTLANNLALSQNTGASGIDMVLSAKSSSSQSINLTGLISSGTASGTSTNTLVWGAENAADNSNVLTLDNSANSFVANVRVDAGTLAITSNGALGAASNQVFLNTLSGLPAEGTLRFDAPGIDLNRQVTALTNGASINTNGSDGTISGVFAGTSIFTKLGTGTLTLSNAGNTFSGVVNVSAGRLMVNGNLAGNAGVATNVNNGGTLAGTGSLGSTGALRNVTVNNGGTLAPGNPDAAVGVDPGTLAVNGNVNVGAGGNFQVRLTTALVSGGTPGASSGGSVGNPANNSYLLLNEAGTALTVNGNIVIDGTGLAFNQFQEYSYAVAQMPTTAAPINITDQSRFQTIGFAFTPDNISLASDGAGFVYLSFTPVPEPATVLGLAAGALGLGGYVRRRFRRA